jgi:fatty-acyl-CoA synthase
MVVEAAFRAIDFAAILSDVAKDELPALQRLAVVGADAIPAHWPCVRFDAFDTNYPPAPAQDDFDLPVLLYTTSGTTKGP